MPRSRHIWLFLLTCPLGAPLLAQTQIGGGTCSSASLNKTYAFNITGRQVTSSGAFSNVLQGNGSAAFDGENQVTIAISTDTLQSVASPLSWTGTYSVQANCVGQVSIATGGNVTLSLVVYDQGSDFLVTGNGGAYAYSGTGSAVPAACGVSLLSGVYTFNGTGYGISAGAVSAVNNAAGLMQFDGQGNLTVNYNATAGAGAPSAIILTGTYSMGTNCLGSAALTDSKGNSYTVTLSVSGGNAVASSGFYFGLAQSTATLINGTGHAAYGQPTVAPTARLSKEGPEGRRGERS